MPTSLYNLSVSPEEQIQNGEVPVVANAVVPAAVASVSPEEAIIAATPAEETPLVVPDPATPVVASVPVVVVPVAEEADEADPNFVKTASGWEYRIDLGDGSGVQVFRGKTQKQVISALGKAQVNATRKIRQQEQERKELIADVPAEVVNKARLKPRALTSEEQAEIAADLADQSTAVRGIDKYIEIRLGGPIDEVVKKITTHDDDLEYRQAQDEAMAFVRDTPEFHNTVANSVALANYMEEQGWASTKRNLRKAFVEMVSQDKFPDKRPIEAQVAEVVETVLTPAAAAVSTAVSTETAAAPAATAVPAVTKPNTSASQPTGLSDGTRVRPGSSSTGMSPRDASVRQGGAAPATPVGLTVEEYQKIPTSQVKMKYRNDSVFRAQVDQLMKDGKI